MRLLILVCVTILFAIGLMMVFNTSSAEVLDRALTHSTHRALVRQLCYAFCGFLLALCVWRVGYVHLLHLSPYLLTIAIGFLLLTFVPGIGKACHGSHRWISLGPFTLQPSEFVKYLIPMVYIEWIVHLYKHQITFGTFAKILAFFALPLLLILLEPDNGSVAVIGVSLLPLFFMSGLRVRYWALPMALFLLVGATVAWQLPYVRGRLEVYLHPEQDLQGKGHQPYQAKIAAGSGRLFGRGPGGSLQKLTYLPEAQNDYIAAIYAEECGFLGILVLVTLYMVLAYGGISIALRTPTVLGSYLAMTITFLVAIQAFFNLGVVSGLLPSKGVSLPFFSQGGSSLVANIMGIALLLNIEKYEEKKDSPHSRRYGRPPLSGPGGSRSLS